MRYQVTFTKYYFYDVEGHDVDTAIDEAYKLFRSEMTCPIADTSYDQLDIEPLNEEEEDYYDAEYEPDIYCEEEEE